MNASKFGITGGIGSGKSACTNYLKQRGFTIVDADLLTREAYQHALTPLQNAFGNDIVTDGTVDRKKLASIVFTSDAAMQQLNAILHPIMAELARKQLERANSTAVLDAAILFETGWDQLVDRTITVVCPLETRIQRIIQRDNTTRDRAIARIHAQLTDEEKIRRTDHVIYNVGSFEYMFQQLNHIFELNT